MSFSKIALILMLAPNLLAAPLKEKENYTDIIKKAQNLTLQQDREQAAQILIRVIKSEVHSKKNTEELKKTLNEISMLFYTEKTQKLFEYAKSQIKEAPQDAQEKLLEAAALEPTNVLIRLQQGKLALAMGKCDEAAKVAEKIFEINPFMAQTQLLDFQAKACDPKLDTQEKQKTTYQAAEAQLPVFYYVVSAQKNFTEQKYLKAQEELQKSIKIDEGFPEAYYWEALVLEKLGLSNKEAVMKYIKLCKTADKQNLAKYELEPRTCQEYKNLETEYKAVLEQDGKKDL